MVTFKEMHKAITRTVHVHSATLTIDETVVAELVRAHITKNIIPNHFDPAIIKETHLRIERNGAGYLAELDIEVEEDE